MNGFQSRLFCRDCNRYTLHFKSDLDTNKRLHGVMAALTILTCGLALPIVLVWLFWDAISRHDQKWHCQKCGEPQ